MARELLAAHRAGRVKVAIGRASGSARNDHRMPGQDVASQVRHGWLSRVAVGSRVGDETHPRGGGDVRISVDNEVCEAHGQCNTVDRGLFTLDDDGYSDIGPDKEVPPGKEVATEQGVDVCPVQALRIER